MRLCITRLYTTHVFDDCACIACIAFKHDKSTSDDACLCGRIGRVFGLYVSECLLREQLDDRFSKKKHRSDHEHTEMPKVVIMCSSMQECHDTDVCKSILHTRKKPKDVFRFLFNVRGSWRCRG